MAGYANFAGFYDQIMGDRADTISRVRGYILRYLPAATSLLELGCGTGALLKGLTGELSVTGIDQSPQMLAMAAAKVPEASLLSGDITSFSLGRRFDVAICMYDTLNHVPIFDGWLRTFERVHEHLVDGGLFIFDVNTTGRLAALGRQRPFAGNFDVNTLIMNVTPADADVFIWEVKIFERLEDGLFRLHQELIPELGVPLKRIRGALERHFDLLEESDPDGLPPTDDAGRIFFACRHRG